MNIALVVMGLAFGFFTKHSMANIANKTSLYSMLFLLASTFHTSSFTKDSILPIAIGLLASIFSTGILCYLNIDRDKPIDEIEIKKKITVKIPTLKIFLLILKLAGIFILSIAAPSFLSIALILLYFSIGYGLAGIDIRMIRPSMIKAPAIYICLFYSFAMLMKFLFHIPLYFMGAFGWLSLSSAVLHEEPDILAIVALVEISRVITSVLLFYVLKKKYPIPAVVNFGVLSRGSALPLILGMKNKKITMQAIVSGVFISAVGAIIFWISFLLRI